MAHHTNGDFIIEVELRRLTGRGRERGVDVEGNGKGERRDEEER